VTAEQAVVSPERVEPHILDLLRIGFWLLEAEEGAMRLPVLTTQMIYRPQPEEVAAGPSPALFWVRAFPERPRTGEGGKVRLLLLIPKVSKQPEEALALVGVALMRLQGQAEKAGLESPVR